MPILIIKSDIVMMSCSSFFSAHSLTQPVLLIARAHSVQDHWWRTALPQASRHAQNELLRINFLLDTPNNPKALPIL